MERFNCIPAVTFIYNSRMSLDPNLPRCQWPGKIESNPLMVEYHDTEWGVPVHDDRKHFEYLVLDAFQAGLSWSTVLNKRENFRKAFRQFRAGTHRALLPAQDQQAAGQSRHHS
jgi:3-methyladenine DNA glycosylase Tag